MKQQFEARELVTTTYTSKGAAEHPQLIETIKKRQNSMDMSREARSYRTRQSPANLRLKANEGD